MQTRLSTNGTPIPFPALTTAQRCHLEVHGYVVVQNVFGADKVYDKVPRANRT